MATAAQTLQTTQPTNRFTVFIRRPFLKDLEEWFSATNAAHSGVDVGQFLSQIIEQELAQFRSLRIRPKLEACVFREKGETAQRGNDRRRRFSPEEIQRVLHLRHGEGMSVSDIAGRLRCGASTVRRYLDAYAQREHNSFAIAPGVNRVHGSPGGDE